MENMDKGYNDLSGFNWESNPDQLDFFGIKSEEYQNNVEETKKRNPQDEPKGEEHEEGTEKSKENSEESPVFESFMDAPEEEEGKTDTAKRGPGRPSKTETQEVNFLDQFNSYKGYGLLRNVELEEDVEDLDEDSFKEILEQDFEEEVNARIETWATQDLDEEAQAFIKFKRNGGKTSDFFKVLNNDAFGLKGDIEDENFQDKVIATQLAKEGWDKDEIEDRLVYLSKIDKKGTTAAKYYEKIKAEAQKESDKLVKQQEQYRKNQELSKNEFKSTVKETLGTMQEVKGIKITPKDRANLFTFITREDQEVGGRNVTGFQKAITEAVQDPEKMVLLAKLLASDFDMSDLEKKARLTETKKIKENLESRKGLRPTASRSTQLVGGKSLADLFD